MASRDNRYSSTTSINHQVSGEIFLKAFKELLLFYQGWRFYEKLPVYYCH